MPETEKSLQERMTPQERELFEGQRALIGVETAPVKPHSTIWDNGYGGEPVTAVTIRQWADANEDDNPLWRDAEYAARTSWGGIIAPPLFTLALDDAVWPVARLSGQFYQPGLAPQLDRERFPTFRGAMQANTEWDFHEPVRPGDEITVRGQLTELFWKQGSRYRLLFLFGEITFRNQRARLAAKLRTGTVFMFK